MFADAFLARLRHSRLVRGVGANVYSQLVQTALQLISVPLLATHWGLQTYGAWLVLFTVPAYLAFADFGFAAAAANDMTVNIARGDRATAIETFHAVRTAVTCICLLGIGLCAAAVYSVPDNSFAFVVGVSRGHARHVILLLAGYGLLSIQNSVSMAAFRSTGQYATGTFLTVSILFLESVLALIVVYFGGNIEAAAAAYFSVRLIGSVLLVIVLRLRAPWLVFFEWHSSFSHIGRLVHPALAVLALPAAQALFLQGTVIVVGLAAGAAAVPAFTAVRTISRIGVQLTMIVNHAVMPEFTVAVASSDHLRRVRLAFFSIASSGIVLLPMFFIVVFGGPLIIRLWTHGAIQSPYGLIVTMAFTMLVGGLWLPISNLILALNRHSQYSYYYLVAALGSVLLSYPLVTLIGSTGAGISLLLLDCVMFARVWVVAIEMHVFNPKELYVAAIDERARLRLFVSRIWLRLGIK
jgi:O-antigen/teichoic acid export membrane protein